MESSDVSYTLEADPPGYVFPNDEQENDRLDIHNHLMGLILNGKLHLAPIGSNPQAILSLATGTGIWAIDKGMS